MPMLQTSKQGQIQKVRQKTRSTLPQAQDDTTFVGSHRTMLTLLLRMKEAARLKGQHVAEPTAQADLVLNVAYKSSTLWLALRSLRDAVPPQPKEARYCSASAHC